MPFVRYLPTHVEMKSHENEYDEEFFLYNTACPGANMSQKILSSYDSSFEYDNNRIGFGDFHLRNWKNISLTELWCFQLGETIFVEFLVLSGDTSADVGRCTTIIWFVFTFAKFLLLFR